jgi:hypothetical protein
MRFGWPPRTRDRDEGTTPAPSAGPVEADMPTRVFTRERLRVAPVRCSPPNRQLVAKTAHRLHFGS